MQLNLKISSLKTTEKKYTSGLFKTLRKTQYFTGKDSGF